MLIFLAFVALVIVFLWSPMLQAFLANPALNGFIVGFLVLGIGYCCAQVLMLNREVNWIDTFRTGRPGMSVQARPRLLAPMAAMLGERKERFSLSALSMRSLLDGIAARLDESREISRYLIGLLIFLGLLGTFWGLLQTIGAVADVISKISVSGGGNLGEVFNDLKAGLQAPLSGMGTAFSSSLFGLAGSLVLGFLDLQAGQAQNRFYNDLEDWLSTVTDISASEGTDYSVPHYLRMDLRDMQQNIERIDTTLHDTLSAEPDEPVDMEAIELLADAVHGLVTQMREEQKVVRQWAQAQADQQMEMKDALERLVAGPTLPPAAETKATRARAKKVEG